MRPRLHARQGPGALHGVTVHRPAARSPGGRPRPAHGVSHPAPCAPPSNRVTGLTFVAWGDHGSWTLGSCEIKRPEVSPLLGPHVAVAQQCSGSSLSGIQGRRPRRTRDAPGGDLPSRRAGVRSWRCLRRAGSAVRSLLWCDEVPAPLPRTCHSSACAGLGAAQRQEAPSPGEGCVPSRPVTRRRCCGARPLILVSGT